MTFVLKKSAFLALALSATLFVGCGQNGKSHAVIEEFMEDSMTLDDYDIVGWGNLGTTHFVSDSALDMMRAQAAASGLVKKEVSYTPRTGILNFIQVKYATGKDTIRQTFYLDEQLTGVVGFKNN